MKARMIQIPMRIIVQAVSFIPNNGNLISLIIYAIAR
jgi:hypothetical protein